MHFVSRKTVLKLEGFQVLGLDSWSNSTCYQYIKYLPKKNAFILIDSINTPVNISAVKFPTATDLRAFRDGKFGITFQKLYDNTRSCIGVTLRYFPKLHTVELTGKNFVLSTVKKHIENIEKLLV
jgi:hypothetical protein